MNEEQKRKAMNAVSHRETATQMRPFKRATRAPVNPAATGLEVKRQAMSVVSNVQTVVSQVGIVPVAAGAAVYAARIREADREMRLKQAQNGPRRLQEVGRERLER